MEEYTLTTLEYDHIKQDIMGYAVSYAGREKVSGLQPMSQLPQIYRAMQETQEAKNILEKGASIPLPSLEGIELVMSLMGTGYLFREDDLTAVYTFLHSCTQLRKYMAGKGDLAPTISSYAASLRELPAVQSEILRCIRHGRVTDEASRELEKARRRIGVVKERIQKKIQGIMSRHQAILQENLISVRNGRYVIPLKKEYYRQVKGSVLDYSTSGQTVFVEPYEISGLQSELEALQGDEAREEAKVLSLLSEMVERESAEIGMNIEITGTYDFIFAKARFAVSIGGISVELSEERHTRIRGAKHPKLLESMIPLDIEIGRSFRTLIITGPNTGGKTVVLKTLGLLTLMVQSGLLIPVEPGSRFGIYNRIMAVIGDGQSIEQSLSTFSAQISSLVRMLEAADPGTLLLIDELAAGTDPGEGIALSTAILEELSRKGASVLVTTHFNELKTFAAGTPGFENARMEFDPLTLQPLYRLTIGLAGQSYAIEIAEKLGIASQVLKRSRELLLSQPMRQESPETFAQNVPSIEPASFQNADCAESEGQDDVGAKLGQQEELEKRLEGRTGEEADCIGEIQEHSPDEQAVDDEAMAGSAGTGAHVSENGVGTAHAGESAEDDQGRSQFAPQEEPASETQKPPVLNARKPFEIGDAVMVTSLGRVGIICEAQDGRGMLGVMVQKQKLRINHKRLKPYIAKEELYPEEYDFDIVFESKENRKKKKIMSKRHVEGLTITHRPDDYS
ncbi:DNA mismatch repair protein MutS [Paenibacillus sp. J22TS3]|uniref:endonuclease MutS2 n=1 Tax=Paenibacillus sp. J22TS3 TaxID=2807192 RepID=UPI001B174248|nr:DNA mismatch repair protein MutS [Paenibacillus sp. J22TS3]GIP23646.1 hypothetical protein J22TS3_39210 [Paenibacillus sp. J22TS3]